ncbi:hypothetical protein ABH994_006589 [Bradyrhizobium yuanmingense]|uniref:PD-(D/E)XK motif protein n=1 Tax=Bradyrhizobium yuanmingense TaxID=108015 RepID=UPI0035160CC8
MESILHNLIQDITVQPTASDTRFFVKPIPQYDKHFVGYNAQGCPSILLSSVDQAFRAPLQLTGADVRYCVPCQLTLPDHRTLEKPLTQVICTSDVQSEREYFLHIASTIIEVLGNTPTVGAIADAIGRLVDILQRLGRPATKNLIGLYGELLFILNSSSPDIAVQAWRSRVDDRFDFSIESVRLDVKATGRRTRVHSFSLEQCLPVPGATTAIVSLFIESSGGGKSLRDLIGALFVRLTSAEGRLRVQQVVADTLGATLLSSLDTRFDELLAINSLRVFDAAEIPAIRSEIPSEVSAVKFQADLTDVSALDQLELARSSSLWRALMPISSSPSR